MKRWLSKAETTLGNHSDRLNAINIFPVADGDTGTNLYLTVRAAARALQGLDTAALPQITADAPVHSFGPPDPAQNDVGAVLAQAGQAAMEQARGNSGTLFAVFLCAAAEPLAGHHPAERPAAGRRPEPRPAPGLVRVERPGTRHHALRDGSRRPRRRRRGLRARRRRQQPHPGPGP